MAYDGYENPKTLTIERVQADYGWLGELIGYQSIGPYSVVTYRPKEDVVYQYGLYINGNNTNCSFNSLDAALAAGIAYREHGPNCQAAHWFIRGLGLDR